MNYSIVRYVFLFLISFGIIGCSFLDLENKKAVETNNKSFPVSELNEQSVFYYCQGEKIFLKERRDLVSIQFNSPESRNQFLSDITMVSNLIEWNPDETMLLKENRLNIVFFQSLGAEIEAEYIDELQGKEGIVYVSHPFEHQGHVLAMMGEFAVKVKRAQDVQQLSLLAEQYGCDIFQSTVFDPDIYFVRCPKDSEYDMVLLSNIFFETGLFEFTAPDFFAPDIHKSNDQYYSDQWGLKNTGQHNYSGVDINVENAWSITEGDPNIIVAVIDDGVELTHPDIANNLVTGYDAYNESIGGGPYSINDYHGTAVAGIIGAVKDNGIGISGVAPGCKIMPIREDGTVSTISKGIKLAKENGADVINCSWGFTTENDLLISEINSAATQGRNGKGCIIVAATGNDNSSVAFPATMTNVIGVGAYSYDGLRKTPSSYDGESTWGSNYGTGINMVAPGVSIATTAVSSSYGYFGKTSAAAPFVSGIAALILSEYPDLTREQVQKAIEVSCTAPTGYSYSYSYHYPYTTRYNNEVGSGRANAGGAFLVANQLHNQNINDAISGFDVTVYNNSYYLIEGIEVELSGKIGGVEKTLFIESMGDISIGDQVGYPVFRGPGLPGETPGATISNIFLSIYAQCPSDVLSGIRIAAEFDNPYPVNFQSFSFGSGDFYEIYLPNMTVPNNSRHRLYINILYP